MTNAPSGHRPARGMRLDEIARELPDGTRVLGDASAIVFGVRRDSRAIEAGDLFVARRGQTSDGTQFIDAAARAGAVAVMVEEGTVDEASLPLPAIVVRDVQLPPGIFKEAIQSGRMLYEVQPAWEPKQRQALELMFKAAVDVGYLDRMPPPDIIYQP